MHIIKVSKIRNIILLCTLKAGEKKVQDFVLIHIDLSYQVSGDSLVVTTDMYISPVTGADGIFLDTRGRFMRTKYRTLHESPKFPFPLDAGVKDSLFCSFLIKIRNGHVCNVECTMISW